MTDFLQIQIGGKHYKNLRIQPVEFIMRNDWDFCAGCMLKHIVRHRAKDGLEDIQKAKHYAALRHQLWQEHTAPRAGPWQRISMDDFLKENDIGGLDSNALHTLEVWVLNQGIALESLHHLNAILVEIEKTYKD